jgi:hypothetical protein
MRLYRDGVVEASTAIDSHVLGAIKDDDGLPDPLFIGATPLGQSSSSYTHFFNGIVDEVHYWNRALSIADMQALFNAGSAGMCKPPVPPYLTTPTRLANGSLQFVFANSSGTFFSVLASTNPALPFSNWTVLSGVTEVSPGQFQFTDPQATNNPRRFYRVRSP